MDRSSRSFTTSGAFDPPPHHPYNGGAMSAAEESSSMSYEQSGVRYDALDACQRAGAQTRKELSLHGLAEAPNVRGESAYLIEADDRYLAHVEEGLGTKNLVADAMLELTGKSYYANVGIDTVATIVNDLVTV